MRIFNKAHLILIPPPPKKKCFASICLFARCASLHCTPKFAYRVPVCSCCCLSRLNQWINKHCVMWRASEKAPLSLSLFAPGPALLQAPGQCHVVTCCHAPFSLSLSFSPSLPQGGVTIVTLRDGGSGIIATHTHTRVIRHAGQEKKWLSEGFGGSGGKQKSLA